jgi:hypothetical protein
MVGLWCLDEVEVQIQDKQSGCVNVIAASKPQFVGSSYEMGEHNLVAA